MNDVRTEGGTTILVVLYPSNWIKGVFCFSTLTLVIEGADDMDDHHHLNELTNNLYFKMKTGK